MKACGILSKGGDFRGNDIVGKKENRFKGFCVHPILQTRKGLAGDYEKKQLMGEITESEVRETFLVFCFFVNLCRSEEMPEMVYIEGRKEGRGEILDYMI